MPGMDQAEMNFTALRNRLRIESESNGKLSDKDQQFLFSFPFSSVKWTLLTANFHSIF